MALTESKMPRWTMARARAAGGVRTPPRTVACVAKVIWFQSVTTSAWAAANKNVAPRAIQRPSLLVAKVSRLRFPDSIALLVVFFMRFVWVFAVMVFIFRRRVKHAVSELLSHNFGSARNMARQDRE